MEPKRDLPGRWVRICGDCWYELFPTEYAPTASDFDDCYRCGELALTYGVNPSTLVPDLMPVPEPVSRAAS